MGRCSAVLGFFLGALTGAAAYGIYRGLKDVSKYPEAEFDDLDGDDVEDSGGIGDSDAIFDSGMDVDFADSFVTGFEAGKRWEMGYPFSADSGSSSSGSEGFSEFMDSDASLGEDSGGFEDYDCFSVDSGEDFSDVFSTTIPDTEFS